MSVAERQEQGGELSGEPGPTTFGTQAARTLYAAIHGELWLHPQPDSAGKVSQDAYSLFYARSAAMGWLTPAKEGAHGGLWGMNDAEAGPGSGPHPARVAFFQVTLTGSNDVLPVRPFLSCAGDVLARLGTLRFDAIQMLLPERAEFADSRAVVASGTQTESPLPDALGWGWFVDWDPRLRARTRVTLDGGPDSSIQSAAPAIARRMEGIDQDVYSHESFSLADDDHLVLHPAPFRWSMPGVDHHRVTFHGTLVEWSLDAVGWLAAFLADASSRQGVSTKLMFAADHS